VLTEGLENVRGIAADHGHSLAVTQSGAVFNWGRALVQEQEVEEEEDGTLRPIIVEGFGEGECVRRVYAGFAAFFGIGEAGELFSWGPRSRCLGHGDTQSQPFPKRVEALQGVRVDSVSIGLMHALALAEDGLVYSWGYNQGQTLLGNPVVEMELLPKPVEVLRGVRVASVAAADYRNYAVADTG
jgi:hypothetical protein